MKILCDRLQLLEAFGVAAAIAPQKTPKPVYKNVALRTASDGLQLLATDGEMSARIRIDSVKVKEAGEVLLPAREGHALLREISDPTVTLESSDQRCTLQSGAGSFILVGDDPSQFPRDVLVAEGKTIAVSARQLMDMVRRTAFAAAREESRYAIHGVLFEVKDGLLRLVATDGRRLAMCYLHLEGEAPELQAVVPLRALQALARAVPESGADETLQIVASDKQVGFRLGKAQGREVLLVTQLLDVRFPEYEGVLPRAADTTVEINRLLLESNLRRVAVLCAGDVKVVRFRFSSSSLEMSAESAGVGRADVVMEVDVKGAGGTIGFNPDYLLEALRVTDNEIIRMDMTDEETPAKFTLGESFTYVLMPITSA